MGSFEIKAQTFQQWKRTDLEVLSVSTRRGARRQSSQQTGCSLFLLTMPQELGYFPAIKIISDLTILKF
jgi:hypothetical protein